jgi:hypothetical protein
MTTRSATVQTLDTPTEVYFTAEARTEELNLTHRTITRPKTETFGLETEEQVRAQSFHACSYLFPFFNIITTDDTDFTDEEGISNKKSVFADLWSDVWSVVTNSFPAI